MEEDLMKIYEEDDENLNEDIDELELDY